MKIMNKKVVIFGATGKVGCYTALYLKEMGYDVVAVGKRKSDNGFFADYGIEFKSVDIMEKATYNVLPQENVYAVIIWQQRYLQQWRDMILVFTLRKTSVVQ